MVTQLSSLQKTDGVHIILTQAGFPKLRGQLRLQRGQLGAQGF